MSEEEKLQLKSEIQQFNFENENVIFDFSFEGAFVSCKCGDFDNFLHDEKEFAEKFARAENNVIKLSQFTLKELIAPNNFRHCHRLDDEQSPHAIIKKILNNLGKPIDFYDQLVGEEDIYQLGYENEVRFAGIIQGNIFRVLFLDYHHTLYPDERRNTRQHQKNKYSLI